MNGHQSVSEDDKIVYSTLQLVSDQELMERFYNENDKVRRCQVVIDWLETMYAEDELENLYHNVDFFTDKTSAMWLVSSQTHTHMRPHSSTHKLSILFQGEHTSC